MTLHQSSGTVQGSSWEAVKAAYAAPSLTRAKPKPSLPAEAAVAALKVVDDDGWHNLVRIDPETGETRGETFPPGSWDAVATFVDRWNGVQNLYYSVNEPCPHSPDKKLAKRDIGAIRFIFADKDPAKNLPFAEARVALEAFIPQVQKSLRPTLTLDSGGGFQFLWRLVDKLDPAEFETAVEEQGRGLAKAIDGDPVQNIDRILRLPGTTNLPTAEKRSRGQAAATARLVDAQDVAFTLAQLAEYAPPQPSPEKATDKDEAVAAAMAEIDMAAARGVIYYDDLPEELRGKFDQALAGNTRLAGIWNGDEACLFGADRSRSGWRASLAFALARCADVIFTAQDFAELVHAWPEQADALDRIDKRDLARDWGRIASPIIKERRELINCFFQEILSVPSWPEPIDIFGDADPMDLGELPENSLPPILEQFAQSEARRKGVSMAFAASAAVGVTAAAIGASLRVQVRQKDTGWTEPASLWLALIAEPGRAKSPTISEATRPLRELDTEHYRSFKVQHDLWNATAQAHKKRNSAPAPGPEPKMRRIAVDDITFEMQARFHADNPRGLLRTPDELMGFFGSFGAYKQKGDGDRTQMLRLFDGGSIMMDRVGAGSIRAEHALMGIVAGTQPEKIQKIARDLGADGMLQRFLFIVDDGVERRGMDERPDQRAASSYRAMLREFATRDYAGRNVVLLSPDAHAVMMQAADSIDALKGLVGMPAAWRGHVEKWGKLLPRIVLTFHCVDQFSLVGQVDPTMPIDAMTVERAANFARFLLRHSLTFYRQNFEPDAATEEGRAFAGYLLTRPDVETVTHRTLYDARTNLRGQDNLRIRVQILKDLVSAGWLRITEQGANGPARCDVNPQVHQRFVERANWERRDREAKRAAIQNAREAKDWLTTDNMSKNPGVFA